MLIGFILGAIFACAFFGMRKSKSYRKTMKDLFIAGRIRQLADDNGIDLSEEYDYFKVYKRNRRIEKMSLDDSIEEELQNELMGDGIDLFPEDIPEEPKEDKPKKK